MNASLHHPVIHAADARQETAPAAPVDIYVDLDFPDAWVDCRARGGDVRDVLALGRMNAERKAADDARFDARHDRLQQAWEGD